MTKPNKAKHELREKIAILRGEDKYKDSFYGEYVTERDREICREWADQILALIKEAGYMKPEECQRKLEMLASELDKLASNACQAKMMIELPVQISYSDNSHLFGIPFIIKEELYASFLIPSRKDLREWVEKVQDLPIEFSIHYEKS